MGAIAGALRTAAAEGAMPDGCVPVSSWRCAATMIAVAKSTRWMEAAAADGADDDAASS